MKEFDVPEPVALRDPATGKPETGPNAMQHFDEYAIRCWLADDRIGRRPDVLRRLVVHVLPAFERARPGGKCRLEDVDWQLLRPIVEDPHLGLSNPLYAAQVLSFSDAFLSAREVSVSDEPRLHAVKKE